MEKEFLSMKCSDCKGKFKDLTNGNCANCNNKKCYSCGKKTKYKSSGECMKCKMIKVLNEFSYYLTDIKDEEVINEMKKGISFISKK